MSSKNHVLGGGEASMAVAAVTFRRMMRGRILWVIGGLSLLPFAVAGMAKLADSDPVDAWDGIVAIWSYLIAILVPLLLAGSIGEEIEERTASYLWSRPLPRWSIIGGKLVALVPTLWIILTASLLVTTTLYSIGLDEPARILGACVLGVTALSAVTAGIASLTPRVGTLIALGYLVILDRNLAWFSGAIAKVSIAYHMLNLAGVHKAHEATLEAAAWLIGMSVVWMGVAAWRIRRIE
jgi:ABC-2 type transport system permease protein